MDFESESYGSTSSDHDSHDNEAKDKVAQLEAPLLNQARISKKEQLNHIRRQSLLLNPYSGDDAMKNLSSLKTNRPKAILFVNLFVIFKILYTIVVKIAINDKHVQPLDISIIRIIILGVLSLITATVSGSSFSIPKE